MQRLIMIPYLDVIWCYFDVIKLFKTFEKSGFVLMFFDSSFFKHGKMGIRRRIEAVERFGYHRSKKEVEIYRSRWWTRVVYKEKKKVHLRNTRLSARCLSHGLFDIFGKKSNFWICLWKNIFYYISRPCMIRNFPEFVDSAGENKFIS